MNEKDWDILLAVYEESSISRAAQKLFITQPALTYRLKLIEKQLGIKMYVKGKKHISFTKESRLLVEYAQKMKIEYQKLVDVLKDTKDKISGELRIGVSSNFADFELPDLLKDFHDLYPNVQLKVHTAWSTNVYKSFREEEDHIGIVRGNYPWEGSKILMSEDEVCIVSANPIVIDELPELPSIRHLSGPDTKLIVEKWWNDRFKEPPNISMEVGNLETCKKLVIKGLGYGILPMYCLEEYDLKDDLYIYPLTMSNGEPILRKLWTFYREEDTKLSVVKTFIDFIEERYSVDKEA
ncbi:DNA-binding transcriptional regulator, LysR family [Lentibacillus halodurans]|uniref:DNA-binding transcriptional regulator, LysR family n=1 Tax=Lentibacillus halodurans TaxID=237679 RepID=A0A1I0XK32_9BACI|nr:LysR family transcriptional regulator [Lentibacillus halodurans]SFB01372.1 DNA-binding transcriptional regulator, LysR family [Lentibacillus halodurans]